MAKINLTSPVGRIVAGSLYRENKTDAEGKPLVYKTGPNAGQPRVNFFFALAIPKQPGETHWANTAWGQQIWAAGHQFLANAGQLGPNFAWKVDDGDSQIPNKKGKKPCENEGWPGNWILKFTNGFAPKIYRQDGGGYVQMTGVDEVKPGYYVEVNFECEGNGSQSQPGVYLNHKMVCFRAFGPEINFGPDAASAGFGQAPLPPGASMTPPASATPMPAGAPVQPPAYAPPPAPGATAPAPLPPAGFAPPAYAPAPIAAAPSPIPVVPNRQFVQMPPPPPAPAAPAAPVAHQMTPAAGGVTYEAYRANGWTDALLVQNGLMLA